MSMLTPDQLPTPVYPTAPTTPAAPSAPFAPAAPSAPFAPSAPLASAAPLLRATGGSRRRLLVGGVALAAVLGIGGAALAMRSGADHRADGPGVTTPVASTPSGGGSDVSGIAYTDIANANVVVFGAQPTADAASCIAEDGADLGDAFARIGTRSASTTADDVAAVAGVLAGCTDDSAWLAAAKPLVMRAYGYDDPCFDDVTLGLATDERAVLIAASLQSTAAVASFLDAHYGVCG